MVAQAFGQVDSCEGSLSYFLLRPEELMKISLVDLLFQLEAPNLNNGGMPRDESELLWAVLSFQLDSDWNSNIFFALYYGANYEYGFIDDFELDGEGQPAVVCGHLRVDVSIEKEVVVCEGELGFLLVAGEDVFELCPV